MFKATRAMAMRPSAMMMMRQTPRMTMRQSPQLFVRQTLQLRSPVPVRPRFLPHTCRAFANSVDRSRSRAVSQLAELRLDRTSIDDTAAHTASQRLRQLKNIPTEIWPLSTSKSPVEYNIALANSFHSRCPRVSTPCAICGVWSLVV